MPNLKQILNLSIIVNYKYKCKILSLYFLRVKFARQKAALTLSPWIVELHQAKASILLSGAKKNFFSFYYLNILTKKLNLF